MTEQRGDPHTNAKWAHLRIAKEREENEARQREVVADLYDESGLPRPE
jgi:hypothetical protein